MPFIYKFKINPLPKYPKGSVSKFTKHLRQKLSDFKKLQAQPNAKVSYKKYLSYLQLLSANLNQKGFKI